MFPRKAPSPPRVLVTGAGGQDGSYLCEQLLAEGAEVFGLVRSPESPLPPGVCTVVGDLRDAASLGRALDLARPDEVYNLAAITFVPASWNDPDAVLDVNALGVERLIRAIVDSGAPVRLCQASSAEIFGAPTGTPQAESDPLRPNTPYGQSKARAHRFVAEVRERHGLFACSAILFNHESPRRPPTFVTRKITMGAARIARGLEDTLELGSMDAARDWGYAPEYMEAMRRMARADTPRDYVVATGHSATVGRFVELAFERVGLDWREHVRCDTTLLRAADTAARIGNPSRILHDLGWKARTLLPELVAIMVDADLARIDRDA